MSVKRVTTSRPSLDRAVSVNIDERSIKSKSVTPLFMGRWRSFRSRTTSFTNPQQFSNLSGRINFGGDSPPAEELVDYSDSFDDTTIADELSVKICKESIRQSILDHMRISGGDVKLLHDIESNKYSLSSDEDNNDDNIDNIFKNLSPSERNFTFLWCAFMKRHDLFDILFRYNVDLNYTLITEGFSAIHLSSFSGCAKCIKWLISKGCDVNHTPDTHTPLHCAVWGNTPDTVRLLLNSGAKVSDTVIHYAVRANAVECLQMLLDRGVDVNTIDACGTAPLHIAADRRMSQCMKMLLNNSKLDPNIATRDKQMTALHYAAEGGYVECVQMLLSRGADCTKKNKKGQVPLHLAAKSQSVDCIEALLKAKSPIDAQDNDNRTPLHAAVGKALLAFNSVEILLKWGADVKIQDRYGYTALHVAALNELIQCVDILIMHDADVSSRTKGGVSALSIVARKTPSCLTTICKKLDASISLHDPEASNREVELKLDFRYLLRHSYGGEVGLLKTLIDEGQKSMLEHPLCGAFLYIKWLKIRRFYFCRLLLSAMFVLLLTTYVLTALAHYCYNASVMRRSPSFNPNNMSIDEQLCKNNSAMYYVLIESPHSMQLIWYVLVIFCLCEISRKLMSVAGYSTLRYYFFHLGNVFEWFSIISVFVISFRYTNQTYTWQNHVGAFSILFGWANLMLMIGQLPVFGTYVAMFTKVLKEFFKLLVAYLCVLIGFTVSFCILFPTFTAFQNPLYGIVKVLVMMTGELDMDMLKEDSDSGKITALHITSYIIYTLFVLFVAVVLMNLVVGIAVHDIQGLHKTAGLSKLVRQTELISFLELALFQGYLPDKITNLLKFSALITPAAYRVVLHVKPLNPREKRLPKHILSAAYDIARDCYNKSNCPPGTVTTHRYAISKENKTLTEEIKQLKDIINEQQNNMIKQENLLSEIVRTLKHNKDIEDQIEDK
ncbi:ankyrin repeat domain 61 water witch [Lycorma delicatula]|uniref:ankyrin repeat domain 61 water witch n=1 Tax=Lycorma delicatula TaxID=130591 RepID=UPI003F519ED9